MKNHDEEFEEYLTLATSDIRKACDLLESGFVPVKINKTDPNRTVYSFKITFQELFAKSVLQIIFNEPTL